MSTPSRFSGWQVMGLVRRVTASPASLYNHKRSIASYEKALGSEHPKVANALDNLA